MNKKAILEGGKELLRLIIVAIIGVVSEFITSRFGLSGGPTQIFIVGLAVRLLDKIKFYADKDSKGLLKF